MADTAAATGFEGSVASIAALLDPSGDLRTPETPTEPSPEEGTLADPNAEETAEAKPEGETEATAEEPATDDEGATQEEPPKPAAITVELDGTKVELTAEEIPKGYLRQQDYSRKTAALAEEKKAFEPIREQVNQERAVYAQLIPALRQQLQVTLPQKPDPALIDTDFQTYVRQDAAYREHLEKLQAAQFEENRVKAQQSTEQQAQSQKELEEGRTKVLELIPDWKEPAKRTAGRAQILDYAKTLGATEEEVSQVRDPRIVKALWDASKYRLLMSRQQKPVVSKGPQAAPAGSAASASPRSEFTRAKQRLAQTGRLDDAAAVLKGLL